MPGAEGIVFALAPLGEPGKPLGLAEGAYPASATSQDLVRIGLVANVPDHPVARGIEHIVQGHGEFDDAKAGAKMTAGDRHRIDRFGAKFVGKRRQLRFRKTS